MVFHVGSRVAAMAAHGGSANKGTNYNKQSFTGVRAQLSKLAAHRADGW